MSDVRYTKEHEWVRLDGDRATVGISDYAQQQLGDVVFVELPEVGRQVSQAAAGRGRERQGGERRLRADQRRGRRDQRRLENDPALVNRSAEDEGWFCRLRVGDRSELTQLMDVEAYKAYVAGLS